MGLQQPHGGQSSTSTKPEFKVLARRHGAKRRASSWRMVTRR
jgi:hypothetical protein